MFLNFFSSLKKSRTHNDHFSPKINDYSTSFKNIFQGNPKNIRQNLWVPRNLEGKKQWFSCSPPPPTTPAPLPRYFIQIGAPSAGWSPPGVILDRKLCIFERYRGKTLFLKYYDVVLQQRQLILSMQYYTQCTLNQ